MESIRAVSRMSVLKGVSVVLSSLAVITGMTALFSNHWIESNDFHAGFITLCSHGVCSNVQSLLPEGMSAAYVFGAMLMLYMPLVLILVSSILHGVSVWKGPSKRRDVVGLICAWLSSYHGLLLVVAFIMTGKMAYPSTESKEPAAYPPTTMMPFDTNGAESFDYVGESGYDDTFDWKYGWSVYVGLIAIVCGLASAVVSSVSSWKGEKTPEADVIPLESDYA